MKRFTRGTTITFEATDFENEDGDAITPDSVTVYLDYPASGRSRAQATVTLTDDSDTWSGTWESSVAFAGTVFCTMIAAAADNFALDSEFQLQANQSNPDA